MGSTNYLESEERLIRFPDPRIAGSAVLNRFDAVGDLDELCGPAASGLARRISFLITTSAPRELVIP